MQFVYGPVLIKCYGGCRQQGLIVSQIRLLSLTELHYGELNADLQRN